MQAPVEVFLAVLRLHNDLTCVVLSFSLVAFIFVVERAVIADAYRCLSRYERGRQANILVTRGADLSCKMISIDTVSDFVRLVTLSCVFDLQASFWQVAKVLRLVVTVRVIVIFLFEL